MRAGWCRARADDHAVQSGLHDVLGAQVGRREADADCVPAGSGWWRSRQEAEAVRLSNTVVQLVPSALVATRHWK